MALSLTDLPADLLALISSKLDVEDGNQGYVSKEQSLSALAKSTQYRPRLCLISTCKKLRHTPEVRALFTCLYVNSGLENYHPGAGKRSYGQPPEPESSKAAQAVESVVKFPGLELKTLRTTVLGISENEEARQRLQQELESLEIYTEYTNRASAGPDVHARLPSIIQGLHSLKRLDLGMNVAQGSPILQVVAAAVPPLQLKVLSMSLRFTNGLPQVEIMRGVGALKSLEEVTITFTQSKDREISLLPLRGLPNLRMLSLSTPWFIKGRHCVHVRKLSEVLQKCCRLTELHMNDVEVDSAENISSSVLRKLTLSGCLCSSSWLERFNCPSLERVEVTTLSLFPRGDEEQLPDPGMAAIERALLARPGPVQRAATGLARFPGSCVSWCPTPNPSHEGLAIFGASPVTANLGAQAACLAPLRGSAAANALRIITFEGVTMVQGAIASVAGIFPNVQKVRLVCDFFPTVLKDGSVAAIVQGWGSLGVLELVEGEIGWGSQVKKIVAQAKAAVQATQHRALIVRHTSFREVHDHVLAPVSRSTPAQGTGSRRKAHK